MSISWQQLPYTRNFSFIFYKTTLENVSLDVTSGSTLNIICKKYATNATRSGSIVGTFETVNETVFSNEMSFCLQQYDAVIAADVNKLTSSIQYQTVYSTQSGYSYIMSNLAFFDNKLNFDAQDNPDATFLICGPNLLLANSSQNFNFLNGARKENVFIITKILSTSFGNFQSYTTGNIILLTSSDFSFEFLNWRHECGFYCLISDGPATYEFKSSNTYVSSFGEFPSKQLNEYTYLKNVNLFSDQNLQNSDGDATVTSSSYNDMTDTAYPWITGNNYAEYSNCSRDLLSLLDYIQNECVPFLSNEQLTSTLSTISSGKSYITSSLSGTYTATGNADDSFLIYVSSGLAITEDVTFTVSGEANSSNIFLFVDSLNISDNVSVTGCTIVIFTTTGPVFNSTATIVGRLFSTADIFFTGENYVSTDEPCFQEGTLIETPFGKKKVECLRKYDLVYATGKIENNLVHRYEKCMAVPIRFVGRTQSMVNKQSAPVRIPKDFFGLDQPSEDLYVSRNHGIIMDGILVPAYKLMESHGLEQCFKRRTVTYYHLELDAHSGVLANNLPAESFLDCGNRRGLNEKTSVKKIKNNEILKICKNDN
jgi:hypothetical protein